MLKYFSILILFILLISSCDSKNIPTFSPNLPTNISRNQVSNYYQFDNIESGIPRCVEINDSISLDVLHNNLRLENNIKVNSNRNQVRQHGDHVYFIASDSIGLTTVLYSINTDEETIYDSIHIFVYKQFIILKADDLIFNSTSTVSNNWQTFFNYIIDKELTCGVGIIGNSLELGNSNYRNYVKDLIKSNYFEIWNHGYNHIIGAKYMDGSLFSEFQNTTYAYQKNELQQTQNLCRIYLDMTPTAFGAPGNAIDSTTTEVIDDNNDIKIWFYGKENSNKMILKRHAEIEFPVGKPIYSDFLNNYKPEEQLLTLQIHPNMWDGQKFEEFKKIIEYLKSQNVTFVTPSEYYFLASPRNSNL